MLGVKEFFQNQFVDINQFLTPRGLEIASQEYLSGFLTTEAKSDKVGFVIREEILRNAEQKAIENGIVCIVGGHSSGKTAIADVLAQRLVHNGAAKIASSFSLGDFSMNKPIDYEEAVMDHITGSKK